MKRDKERFQVQAEFCKAMAHPVRLQIIDLLKRDNLAVHSLAKEIGVGQANLSQHLAVLRAKGVVRAERRGVDVVYSLANRKIVDACILIREILSDEANHQQAVITR